MQSKSDEPCCLMLPGLDGTGNLFEPLLQALGDQWPSRVMRYPANPGWGYAELLTWLQDHIPNDQPLFILAESFSGPLAIELAARRPQQVRGLVLCCTFAANPRPGLNWAAGLLPWLPMVTWPSGPMLRLLMGSCGTSVARGQMAEVVSGLPPDLVRARLAAVMAVDVRPVLPSLRQPVWVLQADADALVPSAATQELCEGLPQAQRVWLAGPHALLQACPEAAAAVLRDAWRQCFPDLPAESASL
jgi:pimeloyl-ACP methyl ester carboxylesterase